MSKQHITEPKETNPVGRPNKWQDVKELQKLIDKYFKSCYKKVWVDTEKRDKDGKLVKTSEGEQVYEHKQVLEQVEPFLVTGLALALGTTRETLAVYQRDKEFSAAIKSAKERVARDYEKRCAKRGNGGDIFALKNMGWTDKQEVEHSGNMNLFGQAHEALQEDE